MRMNNARANLGKSLSIETKHKISIANKGKIGNRKGVKLSKETPAIDVATKLGML